ncbi:MAG: DUF4058 family protein, partial [Armatimonadetes bacterium]|nr:DUF4058 family protein [Anaerolineae bacterium]
MQNLYPGINPHLNSALQSPYGDWVPFHSSTIMRLVDVLEAALPPYYYTVAERSLQLQRIAPDVSLHQVRNRPDIAVYRAALAPTVAVYPAATAMPPTLVLPLDDDVEEEPRVMSVVVYHFGEDSEDIPITRFELLSPGNKPGGGHAKTYLRNRRATIEAGLNLVEIDWLHETPPITNRMPSYPARQPDAYPYSILITDPRPLPTSGMTAVYSFRVSDPVPSLWVPLADDERVLVDFGQAYNNTFERQRVFAMKTHYDQLPARF